MRGGNTAGLKYDTIADLKDVTQLDKLGDKHALVLIGKPGSGLNLQAVALP